MSAPKLSHAIVSAVVTGVFFCVGFWVSQKLSGTNQSIPIFSPTLVPEEKPLEKFTIPNLGNYPFSSAPIKIESLMEENDIFSSYIFSYTSYGKKITGQLNVPKQLPENPKVIIMVRGYIPAEDYQTGMGSKNAAAFFASHQLITIAPDFLGFGESDNEPEDTWEARFIKPINIIELVGSLEQFELPLNQNASQSAKILPANVGIWAHSNGGQITLSTLEILQKPIPTTLWAPMSAPFPYSILFFGDDLPDEGREQRAWIALFESKYTAADFSYTQFLDQLTGPIQLHHGTADTSSLISWSKRLADKIETINTERNSATEAAKPPIDFQLFEYPGADHNLQPFWNQAINKDLSFFEKYLR